jgi:hypothetical protein
VLGYHFALTGEQERRLLAAADAGDRVAVGVLLEEIEEDDGDELRVDTDMAWDAIHRCLSDGTLDPDGGTPPLSLAVLGGRHMHDDYYVVHVTAAQARDVAAALRGIDKKELRRRYDAIAPDYGHGLDDEDFAYTWTNFVDMRDFFGRAATAGRPVIFTAT